MKTGHSDTNLASETGVVDALECLRTAFGAALIPVRIQTLARLNLIVGPKGLPVPLASLAPGEAVTSSKVLAACCGPELGLLGLVFPSKEGLEQVLTLNPVLANTLLTKLQGATVLWLRPDFFPPNSVVDGVMIISRDGAIPVHVPPGFPVDCGIEKPGLPAQVALGDLLFTAELADTFLDWSLRHRFGPPFLPGRAGRKVLNAPYWAVRISTVSGLKFNAEHKVFVRRSPGDSAETVLPRSQLPTIIAGVLQQARNWVRGFPAEAVCAASIKAIIAELESLCLADVATEAEAHLRFAQTCIERRSGARLSKSAAAQRLEAFRKTEGLVDVPEARIRSLARQAIWAVFRIRESHDHGRCFHNLSLRDTGITPAANVDETKSMAPDPIPTTPK